MTDTNAGELPFTAKSNNTRRPIGWWLFGLLLCIAAGMYVFWPHDDAQSTYKIAVIDRGPVIRQVAVVGTLNPATTVEVGAQVSGQIIELAADYNSVVKKGQILAKLNPKQFNAKIQQADADLAIARANLSSARAALLEASVNAKDSERQLSRAKDLFARKLLAETDVEAATLKAEQANAQLATKQAQVEVAQASIRQREAVLADANTNLEYTIIRAPVDGMVIQRKVNVGQTLTSNMQTPVLFVLAEAQQAMQLEASVDEADIGVVQVGQPVSFTVDAFGEQKFSGSVASVRMVPTSVQNVVTYTVIIQVNSANQRLLPGMTANANIEIARLDDTLRVANAALRFQPEAGAASEGASRAGGGMVERFASQLQLDEGQKQTLQKRLQEAMSKQNSMPPSPPGAPGSGGNTGNRGVVRDVLKQLRSELKPAQQNRLDEMMAEFGSGTGAVSRKRLWLLDDNGALKAVPVKLGASDESYTAILDGELSPGAEVVIGRERTVP
ncbi:HlyD family efflux transporter periplasmic adaptor subunit [Permianibacter sp. IMCC34836]|uniref:efflux RND transporter periplasmic adaptor subunit n=1 Tax=Permianibacter fluminis TaxID=2738515 RepID=UPI001552DE27|nr:efflux RND transporter periplasmic adaptor subunit [Permianibacter fluminis]NQD38773.1 HlyD family efflux transporter periplasmic adaptor subunit [Permianibacter fluminis]